MDFTKCFIVVIVFVMFQSANAQHQDYNFKDRRIVNTQSTEMLPRRTMDFRVGHKFGDLLGDAGGWQSFYGLENSADISIGLEGGLTDNINLGIFRTKGSGELRQNVNMFAKFRVMQQSAERKNPMAITVLGMTSLSTMPKSDAIGVLSNFQKFQHRLSYHLQIMISRKFVERLTLQLGVNYTYRNLVFTYDQNDLPSISVGGKVQITKAFGVLFDGVFPVLDRRTGDRQYYFPLGIGFEFETGGGHIFQFNLTNAKGIAETDFIPYTYSNWSDGQFRFGFTISRKFKV